MDKWIEIRHINASECAADWEAFAFKALRSSSYALYAAGLCFGISRYSWKNGEVANGYCGHDLYSFLSYCSKSAKDII
jgi:hypothetical protein